MHPTIHHLSTSFLAGKDFQLHHSCKDTPDMPSASADASHSNMHCGEVSPDIGRMHNPV